MEFIVLIIVLALRFVLGIQPRSKYDRWFDGLQTLMGKIRKPKPSCRCDREGAGDGVGANDVPVWKRINPESWLSGTSGFFLSVLLPVSLLSTLMAQLENFIWGLPAIGGSILVLLYCLGRKESMLWKRHFQVACRQGDLQGAFQYALEVLQGNKVEDERQLYQQVVTRVVRITFQDFFLVTFWFMLLGAEGALLARLVTLYCRRQEEEQKTIHQKVALSGACKVEKLQYLFEWLPAKLLGLTFMLAGHFVYCSQQLLGSIFNQDETHEEFLSQLALGALGEIGVGRSDKELGGAVDGMSIDEGMRELEALLHRSMGLWIIGISAALTIL